MSEQIATQTIQMSLVALFQAHKNGKPVYPIWGSDGLCVAAPLVDECINVQVWDFDTLTHEINVLVADIENLAATEAANNIVSILTLEESRAF